MSVRPAEMQGKNKINNIKELGIVIIPACDLQVVKYWFANGPSG